MVTLAITSTIFVISLQLINNASQEQAALQDEYSRVTKNIGLANLLKQDIKSTRRFRTIANGYELNTLNHLDPITLEPRRVPAIVRYQIKKTQYGNWLIRSQLDKYNKWSSELVAGNCNVISLSAQNSIFSDNVNLKIDDVVTVLVKYENQNDQFSATVKIE